MNNFSFLFIGRDEKRKNFKLYKKLATRMNSFQYNFTAITNHNKKSQGITIYDNPDENLKKSIFSQCNIYLAVNTHGESFGITLIEAITEGCLVVCSDIKAFKDVLGPTGIYFENNSIDSLLDTVEKLKVLDLNNEHQKQLQYVQKYNTTKVITDLDFTLLSNIVKIIFMKIESTFKVKKGLAEMLKGGVIMDVVNAEQAKIAEKSGAVAVMALERIPADIRAEGGVSRMSSVEVIQEVMDTVSIPVMAKARIGHFVEAQMLEELGIDFIDESEVLTPADDVNHISKHEIKTPFVNGATNIGEACRRIGEGAAMIRTKGEAGTGNVIEAVRHMRSMTKGVNKILSADENELMAIAKDNGAPYAVLESIREAGRLPVVNFAAGGIATPADAALMMQLGCDGVFVGSGIFKSGDPLERAEAIVVATTNFNNPSKLVEVSKNLGEPMVGINIDDLDESQKLAKRGW
jgi:pyridoxal 5'-phosphate synthase pdxS subunit